MNSESSAFQYDDFEQYLLDAATIDEAPSDLPTRLGVALGLGVPILAASELVSLAPTTTSLHGVAHAGGSVAPTGLVGSLKASLGAGASTLWGTAAKGIAVGLISGTAAIGTGRAVAKFTDNDTRPIQAAMSSSIQNRDNSASAEQARSESLETAAAVAAAAPTTNEQADSPALVPTPEGPMETEAGAHGRARSRATADGAPRMTGGVFVGRGIADPAPEVDKGKPRARLPRAIFPEKTYAIARYPILWDDISAYYDTPKKPASLPAVASFAVEPNVTPTELVAMRTKAVQRSRMLLGQSKAALALAELDGFRARVGDKNFGVDELLLRIEALAVLGHAREAQDDVKNVERLAPNSAAVRQAQQLAGSRFVR